jgi:hypothetical protein
MRHLDATRPRTPRELRSFALTVGGAFAVLAALLAWRGRTTAAVACAVTATLLLVAGLAMPSRLDGVYRAWMRMAELMSRVTTPVFMAIVYFGVLTPLGLARRLFGRGALGTPRDAATGWVRRAPDARRGDMRRQF